MFRQLAKSKVRKVSDTLGIKYLILLMFLILLFPGRADAKRKLPSAASKSAVKTITGQTAAKVKFRSDRKAVILNLSNLGTAKSVSYELQYETNGLMQGAGGSVTIAGDSASREILFGSCSGGVCNYDKNIKNAKLTVTTTLKSGKKIIKPFRLKV